MSLDQDVRLLSQVPLFSHLEPEALRLIAFTAEKISLAAGEVLFRKGESADCGYVVIDGVLVLEAPLDEAAHITEVGRQGLLGETALIVETERPATAVCSEACTLFKIPRNLFLRVMREFPAGADRMRTYLMDRLIQFTGELDQLRQRADARAG